MRPKSRQVIFGNWGPTTIWHNSQITPRSENIVESSKVVPLLQHYSNHIRPQEPSVFTAVLAVLAQCLLQCWPNFLPNVYYSVGLI